MKFKEVIGIDVGKLSNDAIIHSNQHSFVFSNTKDGFKTLLRTVLKRVKCESEEILFVFEHTGIYSSPTIPIFTRKWFILCVSSGFGD